MHRWKKPRPSVAVVRSRRAEAAHDARMRELDRRGVPTTTLKRWEKNVVTELAERARLRDLHQCLFSMSTESPDEVLRQVDGCTPDLTDVAEVWSPPRVTARAVKRGLVPGPAIDYLNGYDLLTIRGRRDALEKLRKSAPTVLVMSPPCHPFSSLLRLRKEFRSSLKGKKVLKEGREHLKFMTRLARWQINNGRYFIFEHPAGADSWNEPDVLALLKLPGVFSATGDQCRFDLRSPDGQARMRKRTRFATNIRAAQVLLALKCDENCRKVEHRVILGSERCQLTGKSIRRSLHAQRYPDGLVSALLECVASLKEEGTLTKTTSAMTAVPVPLGPPELAKADDPTVIRDVRKIHQNMGHPSSRTLCRVLKYGKARPEYVEAAARLRCDECIRSSRPKLQRPSKAPPCFAFNDNVGMDILFIQGPKEGTKVPMLSCVCHGTGHQVVAPLPGRSGADIRKTFRENWKRPYGAPRRLVVDGERGFSLGEFPKRCEMDDIDVHVTSAKSPWQAGKTERAGSVWKECFYRTRQSFPCASWEDWHELVDAVNVATGMSTRRGGCSAYQRVFGRPPRLPGHMLQEEEPSDLVVLGVCSQESQMTKDIMLRQEAMKAYIEADCCERWRRALNRRARPDRFGAQPGDVVMFWRQLEKGAPDEKWHGPARLIQVEKPGTMWLSHHGGLLKCSPEQVRLCTPEEVDASRYVPEDIKALHSEMLELRGRRTFQDLTEQTGPPDLEIPEQFRSRDPDLTVAPGQHDHREEIPVHEAREPMVEAEETLEEKARARGGGVPPIERTIGGTTGASLPGASDGVPPIGKPIDVTLKVLGVKPARRSDSAAARDEATDDLPPGIRDYLTKRTAEASEPPPAGPSKKKKLSKSVRFEDEAALAEEKELLGETALRGQTPCFLEAAQLRAMRDRQPSSHLPSTRPTMSGETPSRPSWSHNAPCPT